MGGLRRWLRPLVLMGLVCVLAWRVGPTAVAQAMRQVDAPVLGVALAAAVAAAGVSTVCVSWRWVLIARALGLTLTLRDAVAASYRAQFLNVTLPVGVAGDVHRAVAHGRSAGDVPRGAYAVLCERVAGQVVQVGLGLIALALMPWPVHQAAGAGVGLPALGAGLVVAVATVGVGTRARLRRKRVPDGSAVRGRRPELRVALLSPRAWSAVVVTSVVAISGHVGTFLLAARAAGVAAVPGRLVPVAFIVLLAAAVPVNLAGWGPREGAAAWAFGATGLGADHGVVVAALYGALVIVASLPGAVVLLASSIRGSRHVRGARSGGSAHA